MSKRSQIIIAIGFDGTIVKSNSLKIIKIYRFVKWAINKLHASGRFYIIIWTCRSDIYEGQVFTFLTSHDISFNSVNRQHPKLGKSDTEKISADIYIDDKNLSFFGLPNWIIIYLTIQVKKFFINPLLSSHD